jgi:hypothetical protein
MTAECAFCSKPIIFPDVFECAYCYSKFCSDHRVAENHQCPPAMAAKKIEKTQLRKKGQNIRTGHYVAYCKNCGIEVSEKPSLITKAEDDLIAHVKSRGCPEYSVVLRQVDEEIEQFNDTIHESSNTLWLYDCLKKSQEIINMYHLDQSDFFSKCKFNLFFQTDKEHAYGYIGGTMPRYNIGIHKTLSEPTDENKRTVTIVLVHELLHAIHHNWDHVRINATERLLANRAGYFDALNNMEILYLSSKMRLCDK